MAMMSFDMAWKRFATPAEKAVAVATRTVSPTAAAAVIERARRRGFVVRFKP